MRIYLTFCSWQKDETLRNGERKVIPEKMYSSPRILDFIEACKRKRVAWAIVSDKYGICFPNDEHFWYDLHPDNLSAIEISELGRRVEKSLASYSEVCFFHGEKEPHFVYQQIVSETSLKQKTVWISSVSDIE